MPHGSEVGGGASLAVWQRQAVLAAAALLRARYSARPDDERARTVHAALLEVVDPARRVERLRAELDGEIDAPAIAVRTERRARGRRSGSERRLWEFGAPRGRERRRRERRGPARRDEP